ncbi:MAG: response regulator, partial [Methanomassiliicoccales archaeon]
MDAIKVLLVDDEEAVLELARDWLESRAGFSVTAVDTAKKALEVLRGNHIDAVVSDFQMEGMDGIELLKAIRAEFGEIPFIFFTGKGREEVVIAAIESGADSYLQKGGAPLHQFTELTHRIKEAVKKRKAEQALFLKNMVFESALTGDSIADVDGTVREVNPTFLDLWGYASKDEVVGLNLEEFIYSKAELKEIIDMLG